ncbi:B3 domain-containing protein At4g02870 [Linum grandiflorum]
MRPPHDDSAQLPPNCFLVPCYIPSSSSQQPHCWNFFPVGLRNNIAGCEDETDRPSEDFRHNNLAAESKPCSGTVRVNSDPPTTSYDQPEQNPEPRRPPLVELQLFPLHPSPSPVSIDLNSAAGAENNTDYGNNLSLRRDSTGVQPLYPSGSATEVGSALDNSANSVRNKLEIFTEAWRKLGEMKRRYSREDEEREKAKGVSTKLKLYEDPWTIRKKLKSVEVRTEEPQGGALLIDSTTAKEHIMPVLTREDKEKLVKNVSVDVRLWDVDTRSAHGLSLVRRKVQLRSKVHHVVGFGGRWNQDFVKRRRLKEGDEVGLCWDHNASRFNFRLIARSI